MAYVSVTKQLISDVTNTICRLRDAEINPMPTSAKIVEDAQVDPILRQDIINLLWEPVQDLRDRLTPYDREAEIICTVVAEDGITVKKFKIKSGGGIPCTAPITKEYYSNYSVDVKVPMSIYPKFAEMQERDAASKEAQARWSGVVTQVVKFLESCKSVNEAIKLWPDVARYLPKEAIDKCNKKTERAAKEESSALAALRAMDMDSINTSTVLARMAGAQI